MNTNSSYNPDPAPAGDPIVHSSKERYYNSVRSHESKEAEFNSRLEIRQQQVQARQDHLTGQLDYLTNEYQQDRGKAKSALDSAKLDLDAAHRSASEHCALVNVKYQPGHTTEANIYSVPVLHEAEAAKQLDLTFGVGINTKALSWVKPILAICCWLFSSLGLGLLLKLLNPRALLANPINVVVSLGVGGIVTLGLVTLLMPAWKSIGTKLGSGRPPQEVMKSGMLVGAVTLAAFLALACLDGFAILQLNAAKAALNPAAAMPIWLAVLLGSICSGLYVLGLSWSNFCLGYSEAARKSIDGHIDSDETAKISALKREVPVKAAIDSLGHVKVVEERIRNLEADIKKLDTDYKRESAEVSVALPTMPTEFEIHEKQELKELHARMISDRAKYEAYTNSRSA